MIAATVFLQQRVSLDMRGNREHESKSDSVGCCRDRGRHHRARECGHRGPRHYQQQFKTRKFTGNFDFLFFGDPQIGSSGNVPKDQAGWVDTVNVALDAAFTPAHAGDAIRAGVASVLSDITGIVISLDP